MDNVLTIDNLKDLKKLVLITVQIYETYNDLADLEINNKKNSSEYFTVLERLKDLLAEEDLFYFKLKENPQLISEYFNYIGRGEIYDFFEILNNVSVCSGNYLVNKRILEKLKIMLDDYANDDTFNNADFDNFEEVNLREEEYTEEEEENSRVEEFAIDVLLDDQIKVDFLRTILKILSLYLNNKKYQEYQDYLIIYKYRLGFIFKDLESDLLNTLFNISEDLYWGYPAIGRFEDINNTKIDTDKDYYAENALMNSIINFIEFGNLEDIADIDIFDAYTSQIITRASLLFATQKTINEFKKTLKSDLRKSDNNKLITNIALESLGFLKNDQVLVRKIDAIGNLTKE